MSTTPITPGQRHSRRHPCPICGGGADDPPGKGIRCAGFTSQDGRFAYCTREEYAGQLTQTHETAVGPTWRHWVAGGPCRCGVVHEVNPEANASNTTAKGHGRNASRAPRPAQRRLYREVAKELPGGWRKVAAYPYHTAEGRFVYQVVRYERPSADGEGKPDKLFRPWQPVGNQWAQDEQGLTRLLYRLPKVVVAPAETVTFVAEGEKCCDALRAVGLTATCNPGGALNWATVPGAAEALRGRHIVILPDNDPEVPGKPHESRKGQRHAEQVAQDVVRTAASVKIVELPGLPPRGDVVDWLASGGMREQLLKLVAAAPLWKPAQSAEPPEEPWNDPVPLPDSLPPVDALDPALLPKPLREWVLDIAARMCVAPDAVAAGALTVAGALVGRRFGIHPKRHDDWLCTPNLWGMIISRPSHLKSPMLAEVLKPLARLEAQASEQHRKNVADFEGQALLREARKAALAEKIKKAAKDEDEAELARLATEAAKLTEERPVARRYLASDSTVEKLGELLLQNPQGLLVFRDELAGWLRGLDKSGREGDREFYLESWNGTGGHKVDRIARGSLDIPALCLSVLGGIQPGKLRSYVYATLDGGAGDDGLLARFQLAMWPDDVPWRNVDRFPNTEAKQRAWQALQGLAALKADDCGAKPDDPDDPYGIPALRFNDAAQAIFDTWRDALERRLRSGELPEAVEQHFGKYRSLMPSLALVFHLLAVVDNTAADPTRVGELAAEQATAWCEYLESHAQRIYAAALDPAMEAARELLRHVQAGEVADGTKLRDIGRHHWSKLDDEEDVLAAAKRLETHGWLRLERVTPTSGMGRPSKSIRLHPSLRRDAAGPGQEQSNA